MTIGITDLNSVVKYAESETKVATNWTQAIKVGGKKGESIYV